jgi:hypothetical protein
MQRGLQFAYYFTIVSIYMSVLCGTETPLGGSCSTELADLK